MTADDIREFLARNVKRARESRGLSQVQLADMIGATRKDVWRWETGLHTPSYEHIAAIAEATGYGVGWFHEDHGGSGATA